MTAAIPMVARLYANPFRMIVSLNLLGVPLFSSDKADRQIVAPRG
jgi:hypothetical protein